MSFHYTCVTKKRQLSDGVRIRLTNSPFWTNPTVRGRRPKRLAAPRGRNNRIVKSSKFFVPVGPGAEEDPRFTETWVVLCKSQTASKKMLLAVRDAIGETINEESRDVQHGDYYVAQAVLRAGIQVGKGVPQHLKTARCCAARPLALTAAARPATDRFSTACSHGSFLLAVKAVEEGHLPTIDEDENESADESEASSSSSEEEEDEEAAAARTAASRAKAKASKRRTASAASTRERRRGASARKGERREARGEARARGARASGEGRVETRRRVVCRNSEVRRIALRLYRPV